MTRAKAVEVEGVSEDSGTAEQAEVLAVDLFTQHYDKLCGERRSLAVPELGITIYTRPINAIQYQKFAKTDITQGRIFGLLEAIVTMAEDEAGNKLFKKPAKDIFVLKSRADHDLIIRIGRWIAEGAMPREMAKN